MSKIVAPEAFAGEVTKIFNEYSAEMQEEVNEAIRDVAKESRKELKVSGDFNNRTGKYRKGWTITYNKMRYGLEAIVHNSRYQLTHLLESGHAKVLWGRKTNETVKAFPHIAAVNDEAQRKLEEEIQRRLS